MMEVITPYVDKAYFGPFGGRTQIALSMVGMSWGPKSTLERQEFRGPPTIAQWCLCYGVWCSVMIMLQAATPPVLFAYARLIKHYAKTFGVASWPLIYQVDTRMRREMWARIRREEFHKLEAALEANGTYPFDPRKPCNRVIPGGHRLHHLLAQVAGVAGGFLFELASPMSSQ